MAYRKPELSHINSMSKEQLVDQLSQNSTIIQATLKQEGGVHTTNTLRLRKENFYIQTILNQC